MQPTGFQLTEWHVKGEFKLTNMSIFYSLEKFPPRMKFLLDFTYFVIDLLLHEEEVFEMRN